jgi:hypothetical protein
MNKLFLDGYVLFLDDFRRNLPGLFLDVFLDLFLD